MKTYNKFKEDLQEAVPLAIMAAPMLPKILGGAAALAGGLGLVHQATRQGQGGRSQPVDYGQGGTAQPRTPNVQRPVRREPKADYRARQKAAQKKRREEYQQQSDAEAQRRIDDLIGSEAERRAAAQSRANQGEIQRQLRRKSQRDRMNQAADRLGLD